MRRLRQLVAQSWHTDEIRKNRPSPIDEAKWGYAVVENSLWEGVPAFLREFNEQLENSLGYQLPVEAVPVRFTAWMGGDRDGNPNVTADITRHALLLSRWKATDLFLRDIAVLVSELSMTECTPELRALAGGDEVQEPYRELMKKLRTQLTETQVYLAAKIKGERATRPDNLLVKTSSFGNRCTPVTNRSKPAAWVLSPMASCWTRCAAFTASACRSCAWMFVKKALATLKP